MCIFIFLEYEGRIGIAGSFDDYMTVVLGMAMLFHRGCFVVAPPLGHKCSISPCP